MRKSHGSDEINVYDQPVKDLESIVSTHIELILYEKTDARTWKKIMFRLKIYVKLILCHRL